MQLVVGETHPKLIAPLPKKLRKRPAATLPSPLS